jgi:TolB protein
VKVVGAAALAAFVLAGASASAAERAFPGANGRIVFVSDRTEPRAPEIYSVGIDGRGRRNLTRTPEWDSEPQLSPDGRRILFQSVHEGRPGIFVMNADGGGRRLVTGGDNPAWAPDSRRIAFENCCGWVAVRDLDTGEARLLKQGRLPAWSPDGRTIAFLGAANGWPVHVVGVDGNGERRLAPGLAPGFSGRHRPAWSPDSVRIAFAGGPTDQYGSATASDLYVVRVADGRPTLVASGDVKSAPRWSPDGRTLVYVDRPVRTSGSSIRLVDADGGLSRPVKRPPRLTYDVAAAWSPDGAWIAFGRGTDHEIPSDVYVVRPDGRGLRRLTPPRVRGVSFEAPEWSADGRAVLYASASADLDPDLFTVGPDGGGLRRLTNDRASQSEPAWSPDGTEVAFVQLHQTGPRGRQSSNEEIYVMRADGGGVRRLTRRAGEDLSPSWSPDGSRIVFVRRVRPRGVLGIYAMRSDGGGVRRLTPRESFYASPVWSPDGRLIAFTEGSGVRDGGALFVMDSDGSHVRRLADVAEIVVGPRWSPDGRSLAVVGVTSCGGGCVTGGVYVVDVESGGVRTLAEVSAHGIAWSPDGTEIAVGRGELAAISGDGSRSRRVTYGGTDDYSPDWQPRCTLVGSSRGDRLRGTRGPDLLCGLGGDDLIRGGAGSDRLFGAEGDDRIEARDDAFDVVGCGPGLDTAVADRRDLAGEDCERVTRH